MIAAQALPHTDFERYPTVMEKLRERQREQLKRKLEEIQREKEIC